jgi:hypothetical protein
MPPAFNLSQDQTLQLILLAGIAAGKLLITYASLKVNEVYFYVST